MAKPSMYGLAYQFKPFRRFTDGQIAAPRGGFILYHDERSLYAMLELYQSVLQSWTIVEVPRA
jgi:hypothetical protein